MTIIGLTAKYTSDINAAESNKISSPTSLGCNACKQNQSDRAKAFKKSRRSSSGSNGSSPLSVNTSFTNSAWPGRSTSNMKSLKPAAMKQESLKHAHGEVQNQFANLMAAVLENSHGSELQCCITYSKPCGCIRKYILGGEKWKENTALQLRNAEDIDAIQVATNDKSMIGHGQIERARELVSIYEHAGELKKEKCYAFNNVEVEGKSLKELRGMIGLGNGRKRSKKYEDYVLQMRSKLRNQYALCEKAAQKLLGYSINFLYKKLRTNPQKTSRLVATNKAERASKAPRHLIPLEELREMGRKSNGTNQCCGRNCISRLASQQFDKIENWRKRLEGSGQRVAQEIVAEVLRASSSSLDGQSSFCQNLVHWVTGCSFKKIRRVRDHLKKDPQSLPEHGLKKYWKDKVKNKQKSPPQKIPKTEKQDFSDGDMMHMDGNMYYYGNPISAIQLQQPNFCLPFNGMAEAAGYNSGASATPPRLSHYNNSDSRDSGASTQWPGTNLNNSNNMLMPARGYGGNGRENKPVIGAMPAVMQGYSHQLHEDKNSGTPDVNQVSNTSHYQNHASQGHTQSGNYLAQEEHQFRMQHGRLLESRQMTASPYQGANDTNMNLPPNQPYSQQQQFNHGMKNRASEGGAMQHSGQAASRGSVILHTAGSQLQQPSHHKEPPPYGQNAVPGGSNLESRNDAYHGNDINNGAHNEMIGMPFNHANQMYGQHYYIAAANNGHDSANFFHGGMPQGLTPFVLSSGDPENVDESKNGDYRQPFYILSPIPHGEKGFSASDLKNIQQLPLTPIQILPTPYLPAGKGFEHNGDGSGRQDPQHFFFPMPVANAEAVQSNEYEKPDGGQDTKNTNQNAPMQFPAGTALTSLAVVHGGSGFLNFGSWPMPNQTDTDNGMQSQQAVARSDAGGQQWPVLALQQYPPNVSLDQVQNQAQVVYDSTQFQTHQAQYASATMQTTEQVWGKNDGGKKIAQPAVTGSEQSHSTEVTSSSTYRQTSAYEEVQGHKGGTTVDQRKENHEDEKDGDGIVTPNIIREALSNNFGARVAGSGVSDTQASSEVPPLAPIAKKTGAVETKVPPPLEMPKLHSIESKANKQGVDQTTENEERCASISAGTRLKRFSRDRLRATIDSPNIVLTPFTPLTPSITPVIVIPDTSGDETAKENSASSTNSQQRGGDIFRFPPTHVSRRAAAIRLQGQTISDQKLCKTKSPKDSPRTPGPFPVAVGTSPAKDDVEKSESNEPAVDNSVSTSKTKSPALTLRGLNQSSDGDKLPKDKIPVLGFDAANWQDGSTLPSPRMEGADDSALNTPTQQPLNTPTSLNTPTQQLNTPNQDLKTPTESPVKASHPLKRKRDASPPADPVVQVDDMSLNTASGAKSTPSAAKSLRFHCFTPKDFNDGVNCSAFRKPSEFASTPTDSAIAQRRRRPRKQPHPSSVTTPEDENGHDIEIKEVDSPEGRDDENDDCVMEVDDKESAGSSGYMKEPKASAKAFYPGFPRIPDGNVRVIGNPYDSQTPSLFYSQLITPSLFPSSSGVQDPSGRQQTPFSSQQVNTPVFLHSATFLTPGGSGLLRKISPGGAQSGPSNTPQIFTFMSGGLPTPNKAVSSQESPEKIDDEKSDSGKTEDREKKTSESESIQSPKDDNAKKRQSKARHKPMTLPISDVPPSPALSGRDGGLQTPSNLNVVTPSLAVNSIGSVTASESQQIFNFPSCGLPGLYPVPPSMARSSRGNYVLCTPSKASPTGSVLYHPCTSPSMATGPMALVPIEMITSPQKKITRSNKESPGSEVQATATESDKSPNEKDKDSLNDCGVPVIVVEPPGDDGKAEGSKKSDNDKDSLKSTEVPEPSSKTDGSSAEKKMSSTHTNDAAAKPNSLTSPKGPPKPLIMNHVNVDNPNVQTPTMIHLVSPSHHGPNSPFVLYPMVRPPLGLGQPGMKMQSPLSASSGVGTPPLVVFQRFCGPGGSSSLLKSALLKNMPVFQFPPTTMPSASTSGTSSGSDGSAYAPPIYASNASGPATSASSSAESTETATSSAAVSVICSPRASNQNEKPPEQLSNDPYLSEAAQKGDQTV